MARPPKIRERVLQALRTLRHGPWWPPLDELLDRARHFFAGSLGESARRAAAPAAPLTSNNHFPYPNGQSWVTLEGQDIGGIRASRVHRLTRRRTVTATTPTPASPAADQFYDARRGVYYTKPVMRGWLHLLWFGASLVLGTLLLARSARARPGSSFAVYAVSVGGLFGVSALYHCGTWSRRGGSASSGSTT